jgi:two-component system LytT family sensor kinase
MKPELAREMIVKLANILRALLKDHDSYVPLSEELKFTDDYLDIEVVRFGADKLRVEKEIDPRTLASSGAQHSASAADRKQHQARPGAAHQRRNGHLRSRLEGDRVRIEVADDGVGMGNRPASALSRSGAASA